MTGLRVLSLGLLVADVFVPPITHLPGEGELVGTGDFLFQSGGCAANVAVALTRLGVETSVCGVVGNDLFGDFVARELASLGIDASRIRRTDAFGTAKTVIFAVQGEDRRYIHTFGANAALTASALDPDALAAVDAVYIGGYLLLPGLDTAGLTEHLEAARANGAAIVLDVATESDRPVSIDDISALLPHADYFIPNDDEARAITGEVEPSRQAELFLEHGARHVVIKRGAAGTYVRSATEEFELGAPSVAVVDPSGAGDAFAAGLIVGILEGWEIERSVRFGTVIGASACTALGCSAGIPERAEADRLVGSAEFLAPVRVRG